MEPRIISYMSNLGKIIVLIILYIALFGSCSVGQRHVQRTGLYRLVNGYDIYYHMFMIYGYMKLELNYPYKALR